MLPSGVGVEGTPYKLTAAIDGARDILLVSDVGVDGMSGSYSA